MSFHLLEIKHEESLLDMLEDDQRELFTTFKLYLPIMDLKLLIEIVYPYLIM